MCFSASASFTSSAGLALIGLLTLKRVKTNKLFALAAIPLFFSLQQFVEGMIWLSKIPGSHLNSVYMYGFFLFACLFWPIWIPFATYIAETNREKKHLLFRLLVSTPIFPLAFVPLTILRGVHLEEINGNLSYTMTNYFQTVPYAVIIAMTYILFYSFYSIAPLFISSVKRLWIFGLLLGLSWICAQILYSFAFLSVWCYFSALLSFVIYFTVTKRDSRFM